MGVLNESMLAEICATLLGNRERWGQKEDLASRYEEGAIRCEGVDCGMQADVFSLGRPALAGCIIPQPLTP